ncbi:phage major capsid protein [Moritella viscosa]|nr:phage major capsid protein [Moritella viscosa]SHO03545.1 Phage major capsid protein, HK97 family [Moritella viscosa]
MDQNELFEQLSTEVTAMSEKQVADLAEVKQSGLDAIADAATKNSEIVEKQAAELINLQTQISDLSDQQAKGNFSMESNAKTFDLNAEVKSLTLANPSQDILSKGLTTADQASAGVTIRTAYAAGIVKPLRENSAFLSRIAHQSVANEDYKRLVKTGDAEMRWGGENVSNSALGNTGVQSYAEVTGTFGKAEAYPFVTSEMVNDSAFDLVSELSESVIAEIGAGVNKAALNGDGVKKPLGLLQRTAGAAHEAFSASEIGASNALPSTTANTVKALRSIVRSVKTGYRANAVWMMNEEMRDAIAGKVYSDGRSIINEDVTEMPDGKLLGKEIVIDSEMPNGVIVFGELAKAFTFLTVEGLVVQPNPYVAPGNVQYYHSLRVGTIVNDVQAIVIVTLKATA